MAVWVLRNRLWHRNLPRIAEKRNPKCRELALRRTIQKSLNLLPESGKRENPTLTVLALRKLRSPAKVCWMNSEMISVRISIGWRPNKIPKLIHKQSLLELDSPEGFCKVYQILQKDFLFLPLPCRIHTSCRDHRCTQHAHQQDHRHAGIRYGKQTSHCQLFELVDAQPVKK